MLRLIRTVRHLKPDQFVYRLYYRYAKIRLTEGREYRHRAWPSIWSAPALLPSRMLGPRRFEFLGEQGCVTNREAWNDRRKSKLWLYNLHYLNDLNAIGAEDRRGEHRRLIDSWIAQNPPMTGNGWEPYPLSLRIVNLVKWFARQDAVAPHWLQSLGLQAQALHKQIEFHLLGNHLLANAKALIFAGAYLDGEDARKWLKRGLRLLDREIPEQFLADGAHFELSPMYHAIALCDVCDLIKLAECSGLHVLRERAPEWRAVVDRGMTWLASMSHPDGGISFFNDAAFDAAPEGAAIAAYAATLGCKINGTESKGDAGEGKVSLRRLESSGYWRVEFAPGCVAILDTARIGPDYLPGHGHADTLSFELSVFNRRVFVNSGTSQYGDGSERQRQRGTAAHNTVTIDGEDSSEVWGGFRVARRAYPQVHRVTEDDNSVTVVASHDGYRRLKGKAVHMRSWRFTGHSLVIQDEIVGSFASAVARFHLHPDIVVNRDGSSDRRLLLRLGPNERISFRVQGAQELELLASTWHPKFGVSVSNTCIAVPFAGRLLTTEIAWGGDT